MNVFWIWLTELNHSFFEYDSKNWFFLSIFVFYQKITDLKTFQHDSEKMNRISKIWLKELNPLHKRTQRIGHQKIIWFQQQNLLMTRGIELFFCFWIEEIKPSFSKLWFKLLDLFWTELTELNTLKIWLTE